MLERDHPVNQRHSEAPELGPGWSCRLDGNRSRPYVVSRSGHHATIPSSRRSAGMLGALSTTCSLRSQRTDRRAYPQGNNQHDEHKEHCQTDKVPDGPLLLRMRVELAVKDVVFPVFGGHRVDELASLHQADPRFAGQ